MPKSIPTSLCMLSVFFMLAACSSDSSSTDYGTNRSGASQNGAEEFDDEDKRVASVLSLSQVETSMQAEGTYAEALQCIHGMDVLTERLSDAQFDEQQREAMGKARRYFIERLQDLGSQEGRTAREIAEDLQQTEDGNSSDSDSVRTAMSCLRRLLDEA